VSKPLLYFQQRDPRGNQNPGTTMAQVMKPYLPKIVFLQKRLKAAAQLIGTKRNTALVQAKPTVFSLILA
jgi:hypothetical protein